MPASSPQESLAAMLRVERVGDDMFSASLDDFWGAPFDCDAVARATLAAAQSCPGKELHSLHAFFLESLPAAVPIAFAVDRLIDGADFAGRRVQLRREKRLLCDVTLSFTRPRDGLAYQGAALDAGIAGPEAVPSTAERAKAEGWADYAAGPVEFRRVGRAWPWPAMTAGETSTHREWIRPRQPLPADSLVQTAALVFAGDFYSHWTASDRLGADFAPNRFSSLDYALWIHRRAPWDGWWLIHAVSEVGNGGRMLTRRQLFSADGALIASAVLEGLYAAGD